MYLSADLEELVCLKLGEVGRDVVSNGLKEVFVIVVDPESVAMRGVGNTR